MTDQEWRDMGFDPSDPADWAAMSSAARELRLYEEGP